MLFRGWIVVAGLAGCGWGGGVGPTLLACARGPDPASDRAAFLALECDKIADARTRDECVLFAVKAAPETAPHVCPGVADAALRDECWFVAVDARELVGPAAAHACGGAGKFVSACHANAISREVSRLAPMPEAALGAEIERVIRQFRRPRAGEVQDMARRRVGAVGE